MPRRFLFLGLLALLLVACADPPTPSESPPSERSTSTERRPEDGGPSEETIAEPRPESLPEVVVEACQANCPRITSVEGEGSRRAPTLPQGVTLSDPRMATQRFTTHWLVSGQNLDAITAWHLAPKDRPNDTTLLASERRTTMFRLTLPTTLTTGFFLLLGFVAQTPVVSAEVFVLQGEGFDADTLAYLQRLKSRLTVEDATNAVTLKAASVRIEAGTTALSLSSAQARLALSGPDQAAASFDLTPTKASLAVSHQGQASALSLDGPTRLLAADHLNLRLTDGSGTTEPPPQGSTKGLGNLFVGYNKHASNRLQTGSHNLVIGDEHEFTSYAAILAGKNNSSTDAYASVLASSGSSASKPNSAVFASSGGKATGNQSAVVASSGGQTTGEQSAVVGGEAYIDLSDPTKNVPPLAEKKNAVVLGGVGNQAKGENAVVCGASLRSASANQILCQTPPP